MKDQETKATLRLPPSLYEQIKRLAKENHRSINKQMIYMLTCFLSDEEVSQQAMDREDREILGKVTITHEAAEAISRQIE